MVTETGANLDTISRSSPMRPCNLNRVFHPSTQRMSNTRPTAPDDRERSFRNNSAVCCTAQHKQQRASSMSPRARHRASFQTLASACCLFRSRLLCFVVGRAVQAKRFTVTSETFFHLHLSSITLKRLLRHFERDAVRSTRRI
jgi:hypothetical protein